MLGRWAVRFTWEVTRPGITFPRYSLDQRPMDHAEAVRYAQSEWSRKHPGVRIVEAHVRLLPAGEWVPVEPTSLCGAIDLETGKPIICHPVCEPDAGEDGEELHQGGLTELVYQGSAADGLPLLQAPPQRKDSK
ncbi:MAG: hypothetical protein AUG49_18855 [Catenulispora sp. 13_1_20CM_3_70_7]|nr:MAG: hypothetical protein AUG49_18855 [Catenulispora sp. 13_1_20CM_3_70_7]